MKRRKKKEKKAGKKIEEKAEFRATRETACVILPPKHLWPTINAYRFRYNKNCHWPPHCTVLFPFVPTRHFYDLKKELEKNEAITGSFRVTLRKFDSNPFSKYIFLVPESDGRLTRLREIFEKRFPMCNNENEKWWPHMTIGKVDQRIQAETLRTLNEEWEPIEFEVDRIYFLNTDGKTRKIKHDHFVSLIEQ